MRNWSVPYVLVFLLSCISLASGAQPNKEETRQELAKKNWDLSIQGSFLEHSRLTLDSVEIKSFFENYSQLKGVEDDVFLFYSSRNYAYAWFDDGKLIEQANNLFNRIINLENEGIYRKIPYQHTLDSLFHLSGTEHQRKPNILLELMLTADYFVFSKLSWEGMNQSVSESLKWHLPRKKVNYEHFLDSILAKSDDQKLIKEPVYRQYDLLKTYLKKYQDLESKAVWPTLLYTHKGSQRGDSSLLIAQVKKRLYLLNDYHGDTTHLFFDEGLYNALKVFQQRNGLTVDGKIGIETIGTLNIPLKSRIRQIIVNMERNRWLPIAAYEDLLAVNIPDFKLHVFHKDSLLWSCNVVVGQSTHPTTVFYGEVQTVVFSPYWNVPESIVRNEILPKMRKNKNYLAQHDIESIGSRNGLPIMRQKPGPNNSLGLVKFLFPNSYNIYLHDTPAKSLFGETARAFSHGCIRVEEPVKLANFLLRHQTEWTPENINAAMHHGQETDVTLKTKVPVFIAYFTAFVGQDQQLNFRKDIYNLDAHLADMLLEDK
jgi:murein L,D-transpeptidase YcbB/YkuD